MTGAPTLCRRAVYGNPAGLQINALPCQREQLAAAHPGVQRQKRWRLEIIGECGGSQIGQQLVPAFGPPCIRRIALASDPLFATIERLPQPRLFVRRQNRGDRALSISDRFTLAIGLASSQPHTTAFVVVHPLLR
jgi:hypothetical protein